MNGRSALLVGLLCAVALGAESGFVSAFGSETLAKLEVRRGVRAGWHAVHQVNLAAMTRDAVRVAGAIRGWLGGARVV